MEMKNNKREEKFEQILKEFNLFPYQEQMVREMWRTKSYLTPVRASGWSSTKTLLTVIDILLR